MASITKRGDHQWRVRITRKGHPPQSRTFETHNAAQAWAALIESEMARGIFISKAEAESTTLKDALERYQTESTQFKKGPQPEYSRIKILSALPISYMHLANIRGKNIAELRDYLLQNGCGASTVVKYLAIISHLFNTARKEWGMEGLHNPTENVKKPRVQNARTRRLEDDEELRLLNGCKKHKNIYLAPMVIFAIETAMRKEEILNLQWKFINMQLGTAHIPTTKNYDSRTIPLSKRALNILSTLPHAIHHNLVFNTTDSASRKAFGLACKRAINSQGHPAPIENLRFHDLRHEAVSRLANIFPAHELARISGHKDLKMLMRYYHPRAEDLAKKLWGSQNKTL